MLNDNIIGVAAAAVFNPIQNANVLGDDSKIENLINRFGANDISGSFNNILGTTFGDIAKLAIDNGPLPDFIKDAASGAIDNAVADSKMPSSAEGEMATKEELGNAIEEMMENLAEAMNELMNEEAEGGTEGKSGKGGNGAGNWLVALAKAMGDVAGKHLGRAVGLADQISSLSKSGGDSKQIAQETTGLQAEMQAETQMFKLAQEATTTIVKSVGEALTTTARKQ